MASLAQSLVGDYSFPPGPGAHKPLFVPSKSLFPPTCGSSVIKSLCSSKSEFLGIPSPLQELKVGKSDVGPRKFKTLL